MNFSIITKLGGVKMMISITNLLKLHNDNGDDLIIYYLTEEDVQNVAWRQLGRCLDHKELQRVTKGVDAGMGEGWRAVVESAIDCIEE
jgi:hypothetical protein